MSEWIEAPNVDYGQDRRLVRGELPAEPIELFGTWFQDAIAFPVAEPHGMLLATADAGGTPSCRVVLMKRFDRRGFVFFSHYRSPKGADLEARPEVALSSWWQPLFRQVRVTGRAQRLPGVESDDYFASRPRPSQIGAWASVQSEVLEHREALEQRLADVEARYAGQPIPRPEHWGGTLVVPHRIEFWQGRTARIHDRFVYTRAGDGWSIARLSP